MDILAAIKREERKLEKQLGKLNHQLNRVRSAAKALGGSAEREVVGVKKRVLSAAGRTAIASRDANANEATDGCPQRPAHVCCGSPGRT